MVHSFNQEIVESCKRHFPNLEAVYLFGSEADEQAGPNSDLDIALLLSHGEAQKFGNLALSDAMLEMQSSFDKKVDLINLREVSTVFQYQVITTGVVLFSQTLEDLFSFEGLVVSMYQKLKEERALIEQDIKTTGEIYAS